MLGKWNDEAGDKIFAFAGNYITGKLNMRVFENENDTVEEGLDKMCSELGWDNVVWATYDARNGDEVCKRDFQRYMQYRKSKSIKDHGF